MKSILTVLADNESLMEAVRSVLERHFSVENVPMNSELSNENLGELVRARVQGKRLIDEAFKEIERYKTPGKPEPTGVNPAR